MHWRDHDDKLRGGKYDRTEDVAMKSVAMSHRLRASLEAEYDQDPDGPYGVQAAMGNKEDWIHWGLRLACHPSRAMCIFDEYQKDVDLHIDVLDRLGNQFREGYQGSPAYVGALHCIFQDTFRRCHLPYPPLLNLDAAMYLRSDGAENKSRMRAFNGYKYRAFGIVRVIMNSFEKESEARSVDIIPPTRRR
jgi:hypothetical protein